MTQGQQRGAYLFTSSTRFEPSSAAVDAAALQGLDLNTVYAALLLNRASDTPGRNGMVWYIVGLSDRRRVKVGIVHQGDRARVLGVYVQEPGG